MFLLKKALGIAAVPDEVLHSQLRFELFYPAQYNAAHAGFPLLTAVINGLKFQRVSIAEENDLINARYTLAAIFINGDDAVH